MTGRLVDGLERALRGENKSSADEVSGEKIVYAINRSPGHKGVGMVVAEVCNKMFNVALGKAGL